MIKEITMPAGGQTTDTSTVSAWLVKKGDKVKRGDALLEIETDKATLTVESFAKGTVLAILAEEGDTASAGEVIAYIGDESDRPEVEAKLRGENAGYVDDRRKGKDAGFDDYTAPSCEEEEEYQPIDKAAPVRYAERTKSEIKKESIKIKAMPNAKLLARENNISLEDVADYTGESILKRWDVKDYMEHAKSAYASAEQSTEGSKDTADTRILLTTMRKVIGRRMLKSSQSIPAFQATVEVNMEQCIALRRSVNIGREDIKVSYNDIIFKCVEAAIRKFPYINSSLETEEIVLHRDVNIGLAVSVEEGLLVPVVRKVQEKNIAEISVDNKENVSKARTGKLSPKEMSGGTITVSNLGMYPVTQFNAIINPPEVCILALAAMEEKPILSDGQIKSIPVMKITGSFDHRVIDGAYCAQFLTELKKIIENPTLALV